MVFGNPIRSMPRWVDFFIGLKALQMKEGGEEDHPLCSDKETDSLVTSKEMSRPIRRTFLQNSANKLFN